MPDALHGVRQPEIVYRLVLGLAAGRQAVLKLLLKPGILVVREMVLCGGRTLRLSITCLPWAHMFLTLFPSNTGLGKCFLKGPDS